MVTYQAYQRIHYLRRLLGKKSLRLSSFQGLEGLEQGPLLQRYIRIYPSAVDQKLDIHSLLSVRNNFVSDAKRIESTLTTMM